METFFAPPERATRGEVERDIAFAGKNPLINGLLKTASGLLAVLNETRQILLVNDEFLKMLGIEDAKEVLGARPGEAIQCLHAHEMEGGCGTSRFCATCGAAVAIVASLSTDRPAEERCIAAVEQNGKKFNLFLKVRSCPISFGKRRFILLFLQDMTASGHWMEIDRRFLHDISNIANVLQMASELMGFQDNSGIRELAKKVTLMSSKLVTEVKIQKLLQQEALHEYQLKRYDVSLEEVIQEIGKTFADHPAAQNKLLSLPDTPLPGQVIADLFLLVRVLTNMVENALEATDEGGQVKLWIERSENVITFCVWNNQAIPEKIVPRIFQRHFSTKEGPGRGLGTYLMRLLGEDLLGGTVQFSTSDEEGTVFHFSLPI